MQLYLLCPYKKAKLKIKSQKPRSIAILDNTTMQFIQCINK